MHVGKGDLLLLASKMFMPLLLKFTLKLQKICLLLASHVVACFPSVADAQVSLLLLELLLLLAFLLLLCGIPSIMDSAWRPLLLLAFVLY
jgi:hypothetical protein